jgi:hypothetical protein
VTSGCQWSDIRPPVNVVTDQDSPNESAYKYNAQGVIPAKFQLTCGGVLVSDQTTADAHPATLTLTALSIGGNPCSGTSCDIETPVTGSANTGNQFRFDDSADQYIYNTNIKGLLKGSYRIRITDTTSGATRDAFFKIV